MRNVFILMVVALAPVAGSADELEELAERYIEAEAKAWQDGEFDALEAIEAPNVVYYAAGGEVLTDGYASHEAYILANREALSDVQQEWTYLAGDGTVFSMAYTSAAHTPTQRLDTEALFVFRVEDGRIAEVWTHASTTTSDLE